MNWSHWRMDDLYAFSEVYQTPDGSLRRLRIRRTSAGDVEVLEVPAQPSDAQGAFSVEQDGQLRLALDVPV